VTDSSSTLTTSSRRQAIQDRVARRILAPLASAAVPHDIEQRLRFARERAVLEARRAKVQAAETQLWVRRGGALGLMSPPWWQRAASAFPLVMLVFGLFFIQNFKIEVQIDAAAEIDSVLLSDELPPDAYSDPGFGEFLKRPPE
jgi:hypothetical protein